MPDVAGNYKYFILGSILVSTGIITILDYVVVLIFYPLDCSKSDIKCQNEQLILLSGVMLVFAAFCICLGTCVLSMTHNDPVYIYKDVHRKYYKIMSITGIIIGLSFIIFVSLMGYFKNKYEIKNISFYYSIYLIVIYFPTCFMFVCVFHIFLDVKKRTIWESMPKDFESSSLRSDEDDDCTICISKIEEHVYKIKCKHNFHKDCLREWTKSGESDNYDSCPNCREEIVFKT